MEAPALRNKKRLFLSPTNKFNQNWEMFPALPILLGSKFQERLKSVVAAVCTRLCVAVAAAAAADFKDEGPRSAN